MEFERSEVYGDDDVQAYITLHGGVVFYHLSVLSKLNKSVLQKCRDITTETALYLDAAGYDCAFVLTPSEKFCRKVMGNVCEDLGEIEGRKLLMWCFEDFLYGDWC